MKLQSEIRHLKSSEAWRLAQGFQEALAVGGVPKDGFPAVAAIHYAGPAVALEKEDDKRICILDPQHARYGRR